MSQARLDGCGCEYWPCKYRRAGCLPGPAWWQLHPAARA